MSAAVFSNNATSQLKWEQVGSKKRQSTGGVNGKPSSIPTLKTTANSKTPTGKMPTIESLPPLKIEKSIYDLLDREDSSDDDEKRIQQQKTKSQKSSNENVAAAAAKKSPKQQKQQVNNQNSLRLTAATSSNQHQPTTKKQETDLDSIMSTLSLSDFNQEYTTFLTLYPNAHSMAFKHMISFLNSRLNTVVDVDPAFNNENDFRNPLSKLDKKLKDFYTNLMSKLNKSECENSFEYIISETLTDTKSTSTYGYKMISQLIVTRFPDLPLKSLEKFEDEINTNRHRHQRCLIALWIIGQSGFLNLEIGLKVWFNLMVKHISIKQYTNLVVSYLNHLLEYHKAKTNLKENEFLNMRQYFDFYELVDDKTVLAALNKETNQKFQNCQKNLHDLLVKQSKAKYSDYFEAILVSLPLEASKKQNEVLECAKLCLNYGKDTYTKWRQIYSKYLKQTQILLKQISKTWSEYSNISTITNHDLKQTLKYFEQNSSFYLSNSLQNTKQQQKQNLIKNSKTATKQQFNSSDAQQMQSINTLAKELVKEHFGVKFSIMSKLFKLFLFTGLLVALFFYWDINQNKSLYTNEVKVQLEKYGLLDVTLQIIDFVKSLYVRVKNFLVLYVPPIYQKSRNTIVYYFTITWNYTRDYSLYAWKASETYRTTAYDYSTQALNYIQKQLPTLTDNLRSLFYLFLNYLSTLYGFLMHYFNLLINFVETNLFGLKHGELAIVFADGFKQMFNYLSDFFKWLNESAF